ncbi:MAG: M61 family metallopeptidase [Bacteroidetes bacterium]|nr:MAG: M61 family metallopeptidase [Bacteroidota bacterium]
MNRTFTLFLLLTVMASARTPVHYRLSMSAPSTHLFEVTVTVPPGNAPVDLHMPAWRTGRYLIQDFSGGVQDFDARNASGETLEWRKTDKDTWRITRPKNTAVTASYRVYANEFNQRTRELNGDHAFLDPAAVFMYVGGMTDAPVRLTVVPYGDWHVTTGLERAAEGEDEFTAPNYEHLADSPVEVGRQTDIPFTAGGREHVISIYGEGNWNADTLVRDFRAIVEENLRFWGRLPYDRYVFLIHCQPNAGGGTEHLNSTIMGVRPFVFSDPAAYTGFLGLVSHEYFHTWNVKQLRPKAFAPYDFTKENYTEELWVSEGATSYFDDLIMVRAGFRDERWYLDLLGGMIRSDRSRPGNAVQSLAASSFDAWVKYWKRKENASNAESDYYGKGSHVSLLLDLEIRHRSGNRASFSSVLRSMFEDHPPSKGFTNEELIAACEKAAGAPLRDFFRDHLYGTVPLPWERTLAYAGLSVTEAHAPAKGELGVTVTDIGERTRITAVRSGSPAETAGLEINDDVAALDGFRVRAGEFNARIASLGPGTTIRITVFRNDRLREVTATISGPALPLYSVTRSGTATPREKEIFMDWLGLRR